MKKICTSLFYFFLLSTVYGQSEFSCYHADPLAGPRNKNVDFLSLSLDIQLFPKEGKVTGVVDYTFTPMQQFVDTIFMDGPGIEVTEVLLDKKQVRFKSYEKGFTIYADHTLGWDETHHLSITYSAKPKKGIYFIGWNDPTNRSRKQIWTQGQGIDNRHWIPGFDDMNEKMTTEIKVAFDKQYKVLSNGLLISKQEAKGNKYQWHYKMSKPHSTYLIMLAIGDYEINEMESKSGVKIYNYYYPDHADKVEPTYRYTDQMIDYMEQEFGILYPWEQYAQVPVQDFLYGAMENTTATIFGDFYMCDERQFQDKYYIGTNAHELVHQWFGDYITSRGPEDHWLHESFATHYQKHFERSVFGEDHFQWNRRAELRRVLAAAEKNNYAVGHTKGGSARVYPKGSLVIDMMKYVVGKDQFNRVIQYILSQNAYGNLDTHDFEVAFMEVLGINMSWFFDQWIYSGGEPHYTISYNTTKLSTDFTIIQNHSMKEYIGSFKMPIVFEVHYTDGTFDTKTAWIEDDTSSVSIANQDDKTISFTLFDPNYQIVKTVDFERSLDELINQVSSAPNMIDRYDALLALKEFPVEDKIAHYEKLFTKEPFWVVRGQMAKQLVNDLDKVDREVAEQMINDLHPKVRYNLIEEIDEIPENFRELFEAYLTDSSLMVIETALSKLSKNFPKRKLDYLNLVKADRNRSYALNVTWLQLACGTDLRSQYIDELVDLAGPSFEFRTRQSAMAALKALDYLTEQAVANIFDAALHPNGRLHRNARGKIRQFAKTKKHVTTMQTYLDSKEWDEKDRELLTKFMKPKEEKK